MCTSTNTNAKPEYVCTYTESAIKFFKDKNIPEYYELYALTRQLLLIQYYLLYQTDMLKYNMFHINNLHNLTCSIQTILHKHYDEEAKYYHIDITYPFRHSMIIREAYTKYKQKNRLLKANHYFTKPSLPSIALLGGLVKSHMRRNNPYRARANNLKNAIRIRG